MAQAASTALAPQAEPRATRSWAVAWGQVAGDGGRALIGAPVAVTGAVLAAAVLHAGWNALLKGTGDRLATVVLLVLAAALLAAGIVALNAPR